MRYNFLVASWGGAGHLGPTLAAAQQLRARGHGVRFIARPDARAPVEAAGYGFVTWKRTPSFSPIASRDDPLQIAYDELLFGPAAARAADTREEIEREPTDALLTDIGLFGSALAAEAANIPCAFLSPTISLRPLPGVPPLGSCMRPPHTPDERAAVEAATGRFASLMNKWLPMLNEARASQGLAALDHALELFDRPERLLLATSAAFDFPADRLPRNVRYVGPLLDTSGWCEPWTSPWDPNAGRSRALVSFSTTDQDQAGVLQRVVNAMSGVDIDGLVTTGPALDGVALRLPKNVLSFPNASHDAVMKEASLVVTHGGHGTAMRALSHGLPLLVMPMGRDQDDIALRVEARNLGLTLPPTASEPEIVAALNRLISEPHFGVAARRLRETIALDVKAERLVREMEEIVLASYDKFERAAQ
jgi:MGT family glycosyltransferase